MTEPEAPQDAFARGHAAGVDAGVVAEQLRRHEVRLDQINGSQDRMAAALEKMALEMQRMSDSSGAEFKRVEADRDADATKRVDTAAALKDADEVRLRTADDRWSPWSRVFALVGALAAAVGIAYALANSINP